MSPIGTPAEFDLLGELPAAARTTVLEASAGTGKTFTIAALVARMVAEGIAPLEEMLIITFGRAASAELRDRVRGRLVEAERVFSAAVREVPLGRDLDEVEAHLVDVGAAERQRRWQRLRSALADFDAATIATTHQFCQLVLASLGVAGVAAAGSVLVEDLDDLVVEIVDDLYLRGFAHDDSPSFDRATALEVARQVVADPSASIVPAESAHGPVRRRVGFAGAVRAELEVRKRRLGVLSYDDLLSRLSGVLASEEDDLAALRMRRRWSVVLVDEFQDTDPIQWDVLERAFHHHARMVLIGDPKQAIYAFRGGDVATYLKATAAADAVLTLGTNQRTDAPLLSRIQTFLGDAQLGDAGIVVHPVRAAARHQGSRLAGAPRLEPLRLRVVERARFGGGRRGPKITDLRSHLALDAAADIRELLTSGATWAGAPLEASDIAVLCATHRQAELVHDALGELSVPAVLAGGGSVFASEGALQWLTVLEAVERPQVTGRVRAAALTAFFGETAASLDADPEGVTDRVAEALRDWGDLLRERGVAAVAEAAGRELPERVLSVAGGERLLTDLRHVAEILHAEAGEGMGIIALVTWLREQVLDDRPATAAERTRRLDSDAAAVQVLTIHASKGLEFAVVYLPFAADAFSRDPEFPQFHTEDGERSIDVGGRPSADHLARANAERAGEQLRLFYVALTRAKSQVVAWWIPNETNTPPSPLHRLIFGRGPTQGEVPDREALPLSDKDAFTRMQRWEAAGAFAVETSEVADADPAAARARAPELVARRWSRTIDMIWRRTSYTALSRAAEENLTARAADGPLVASEPEDAPREDEAQIALPHDGGLDGDVVSPMAGLPVGATFGTLVHQVLELTDPAAPDHGGDLRAELLGHIDEASLRWPLPLDRQELVEALVAVHDTPLGPLAGVTLREVSTSDRLSELDFEMPLHGGDAIEAGAAPDPTLADLAPILRRHLRDGDPLLPYAEVVSDPAYAAQRLRGYLTGSVDVVLRVGERYLVADYKTNWLGGPDDATLTAAAYTPARLAAAMTHSSYPLQALLYAVVLHRFLRWRLRGYEPDRHIGGVLYLYLRGMCGPQTPQVDGHPCGVFAWRPPVQLVTEISDLLDGRAP